MYLRTTLCSLLLISIGAYAQHDDDKTVLKLHNYTGPFPVDKMAEVEEICLHDSTITAGDHDLPGPTVPKLKRFIAKDTTFENFADHKWVTAPNLENVTLNGIHMVIRLHHYKRFHNLKVLHAKNIEFGEAKGKSLEHQKNLESLHLVHAGITGFEKDTFYGLDNLEDLDLSDNQLTTISKEVLAPLKKLKTLVLKDNKFTKLDAENIPELPELKSIDLRGNPVNEVDVEGLRKIAPKLDSVLLGSSA